MSELLLRADRYIDLWDKTSCVEIEVLSGMSDAKDAYYAAPDLVRDLVAEVRRLQYLWDHSGDSHMCDECWPQD